MSGYVNCNVLLWRSFSSDSHMSHADVAVSLLSSSFHAQAAVTD
jgi:hypothetical protein